MKESVRRMILFATSNQSHKEVLMTKKSMILASSLFLRIMLLISPPGFDHQSAKVEKSAASDSSLPSLDSSCHKKPNSETARLKLSSFRLVPAEGCNDPIDNCKKPIKYLGSNGECACFACEYGKATQHNVCTQDKKDKETLLAESIPQ